MRYIREREAREAACRENEQMRIRLEEYQAELESYREAMVSSISLDSSSGIITSMRIQIRLCKQAFGFDCYRSRTLSYNHKTL